jgi:hypothetical protein
VVNLTRRKFRCQFDATWAILRPGDPGLAVQADFLGAGARQRIAPLPLSANCDSPRGSESNEFALWSLFVARMLSDATARSPQFLGRTLVRGNAHLASDEVHQREREYIFAVVARSRLLLVPSTALSSLVTLLWWPTSTLPVLGNAQLERYVIFPLLPAGSTPNLYTPCVPPEQSAAQVLVQ